MRSRPGDYMMRRSGRRQPQQGTENGRCPTHTSTVSFLQAGPERCHCVPIVGRLPTRGRLAQRWGSHQARRWRVRFKWERGRRRHWQETLRRDGQQRQVESPVPREHAGPSMKGIARTERSASTGICAASARGVTRRPGVQRGHLHRSKRTVEITVDIASVRQALAIIVLVCSQMTVFMLYPKKYNHVHMEGSGGVAMWAGRSPPPPPFWTAW